MHQPFIDKYLLLALDLMNRRVSGVYEIAKVIYGEDEILSELMPC